ncbi:hypothetical protein JL101_031320 (plasmid) [Skermanella rosea]|uniref:FGGY family carbohydrate kinase n=1 Tax=Skermanella rosea TaxID=1817965 RepID=UPI001933D515|nr:FGGY family carbohydrate kinase [Skermanella rosea]UEM06971.1 hypothetical protein JL101_031320 [Skermanella rosea]
MRNENSACIAVFEVGSTDVRLSVATRRGTILETVSAPNPAQDGPPYRHYDLTGLESWLLDGLRDAAARHVLGAFVACGAGGVLVTEDGPAAPMIDPGQPLPAEIGRAYADMVGPPGDRGGPALPEAIPFAGQLLWLEHEFPEAFGRARWFLGLPQYWAWRLSGAAVSEVTVLGAQSNLWNVRERRFTAVARAQAWDRLIPPMAPAWAPAGRLRPELAQRLGLPADLDVLAGLHRASANFYRYQAAGHAGIAVVSAGQGFLGLADTPAPDGQGGERGFTCADVEGRPLAGAPVPAWREVPRAAGRAADLTVANRLIEAGVLPSPGAGGTPAEKRALEVIRAALLTDGCLDALGSDGLAVLDGTLAHDPLYSGLVSCLRRSRHPDGQTLLNTDARGSAAGAALLADHVRRAAPVPISLEKPPSLHVPGLRAYRSRWLDHRSTADQPQCR